MLASHILESSGVLLTILTPLITVPLTAITFYIRSVRDQQRSWQETLTRRIDSVEKDIDALRGTTADFCRDFTSKEEWLRECMHARRSIDRLSVTTVRLETNLRHITQNLRATWEPTRSIVAHSQSGGQGDDGQSSQSKGNA